VHRLNALVLSLVFVLAGCRSDASSEVPATIVKLCDIAAKPESFANKEVETEACFSGDELHASYISTSRASGSGCALLALGDFGGPNFSIQTQRVCGRFKGKVLLRPSDESVKPLCPESCIMLSAVKNARVVWK
jgi:hypothetical protein